MRAKMINSWSAAAGGVGAMSSDSFGLLSNKVVTPTGVKKAVVLIDRSKGVITSVIDPKDVPSGISVEDLGDFVLMPGLIDSHVHVNEPGRTEWEGFETATRAAAAGGITTIADMPLNSNPVTTTLDALHEKLDSTKSKLWVDCAFYGGVVPGNAAQLESMIQAGVVGFKCFLIHSGIDDFPNVTESDLHQAMPILARHGIPLLVHAELEEAHGHSHDDGKTCEADAWTDSRSYKQFLESRPRKWEDDAINLMLTLCEKYSCPVHIVHLSSSETLPEIKSALQRKLPFTVETCPHYLTFASEEIPDGDPRFKCAPPIRERENREKLWEALKADIIKIVVSDHSPCTPSLKFLSEGDLKKAWGGISSLQFRLPVIWSEASKRQCSLTDITRWLCEEPADFLGLGDRKGRIASGYDADLVIWDPATATVFSGDNIHHKHKVTPYDGRQVSGKIVRTYLRGQTIWQDGKHTGTASGARLLRTPAKMPAV